MTEQPDLARRIRENIIDPNAKFLHGLNICVDCKYHVYDGIRHICSDIMTGKYDPVTGEIHRVECMEARTIGRCQMGCNFSPRNPA